MWPLPIPKGMQVISHVEVVAVCKLDKGRAEQFAATHGFATACTVYGEMLESGAISTVDVGKPTFLHASITRQAGAAAKHIHWEKPFYGGVGEGLEGCEAACRRGVKLVVGETYVFIASHMKARELIEAGEIGGPLQMG